MKNTLILAKILRIRQSDVINKLIQENKQIITNAQHVRRLMKALSIKDYNQVINCDSTILNKEIVSNAKQLYKIRLTKQSKQDNQVIDTERQHIENLFTDMDVLISLNNIIDQIKSKDENNG